MTPQYSFLLNFAGTHDTPRIATLLGGEQLQVLVLTAILTMEGIPLLYYGDELGMEGGEDPDNRRAMRWDLTDTPLAREIRALANFRAQNPVLRRGSMAPVFAGERVLSFTRSFGEESCTVVINFGAEEARLSGTYREVLLGEAIIKENGVRVPAMRYVVVR
jgi:glycosidase